MEFQSLEDKAECSSLQSLRVQHGPDHLGPGTEDLGAGRDLSAPVQARPPLGKPGLWETRGEAGDPVQRGEAGSVWFSHGSLEGITVHREGGGSPAPDFLPSQLGQRRYLARILSAFGFEA